MAIRQLSSELKQIDPGWIDFLAATSPAAAPQSLDLDSRGLEATVKFLGLGIIALGYAEPPSDALGLFYRFGKLSEPSGPLGRDGCVRRSIQGGYSVNCPHYAPAGFRPVGDTSVLEPKSPDFCPQCALLPPCSVPRTIWGEPMHASLTDALSVPYSDLPPVLVAGTSVAAQERGRKIVESSGLRLADAVGIEAAPARIDMQASASALWVELDRDPGPSIDPLLDCLNRSVGSQRLSAVVTAPGHLLDRLVAGLEDDVQILIDADDVERAAALAIAVLRRADGFGVSDVTADKDAARLRQLSDEVSRIAATLARLSAGPNVPPRPLERAPVGDIPEVSVDTIRGVIRARRLRSRYFPDELFADPAWDMLLDLLQAEISHLRVPVSSLCIAAAVPATTALRWLKTMTQQGLSIRRADPHDGRRVFVELAPQTSHALRRYFAEVGQVAVI